jgi:hypothetical protein
MLDQDFFPTAVYRIYDTSGTLLYVGMGDGRARIKSHLKSKPWRHDIDPTRTAVEWFNTRAEATAAEKAAIRAERPRHNVIHQPRPPRPKAASGDTNARRKTVRRQIALSDALWERLGRLVGDRGRSEAIRALVAWYLREPGAKLPERPPRQDPSA